LELDGAADPRLPEAAAAVVDDGLSRPGGAMAGGADAFRFGGGGGADAFRFGGGGGADEPPRDGLEFDCGSQPITNAPRNKINPIRLLRGIVRSPRRG
jgi:hypothetical protein